MARKVENQFRAEIRLNGEKGGAWLAYFLVQDETGSIIAQGYSAWKNASAAKRWIKESVKAKTPRKSVPLIGGNFNEKEKPTVFTGSVTYKVDA